MYIGLKHLHSFLPYLLLTVLIFAFVRSVIAYRGKHPHTEGLRKNGLILIENIIYVELLFQLVL